METLEKKVDVLLARIQYLEQEIRILKLNEPVSRKYALWTPKEEEQLIRELKEGKRFNEIALLHNRSGGGIRERIKKVIRSFFEMGKEVSYISKELNLPEMWIKTNCCK